MVYNKRKHRKQNNYRISALLIFGLLITLFSNALTANAGEIRNTKPSPYQTATQPIFDGLLDSVYLKGALFNTFRQIEPDIFSNSKVKTEIYLIYDSENIYIAGKLFQDRNGIKASSGRKDSPIIMEGDYIAIALDPLNNGNSANFFVINPANGLSDGIIAGMEWDMKWDGVFKSATAVHDDHWTFEFQLPLASINFQNKAEQTWGIMFLRNYALGQEKSISNLVDKNNPARVADFEKLSGFKNLKQKNSFTTIPYAFYSYSNDFNNSNHSGQLKIGGEFKYKPVPTMSVLATINPDFAQIETDAVVINVNDVPVSLPERRPFFTESSDLYPGLAVNTRNINEINAGVKLRQVVNKLKYDLTWVQDRDKANWHLGNARWTNNKTFHSELITGIKNNNGKTDYNITTNLRMWAFKRRLTAVNWVGTINRPGSKNEFETVNGLRWTSRELNAGLWSQYKTPFYNPNIVGHNTLSNESIYIGWINYSLFNKSKFLRTLNPEVKLERKDLYSAPGNAFYMLSNTMNTLMYINEKLGNWSANITHQAAMDNFFRYRFIQNANPDLLHQDAYGKFILVKQKRSSLTLDLKTDYSKSVGLTVHFNNREIRQSKSGNFKIGGYWKMSGKTNLAYSFEALKIHGSDYQENYAQAFHLVKIEHNVTDKINLRTIFQLNRVKVPDANGFEQQSPLVNLTASWEYRKGSFVFIVFNKYASTKTHNTGQAKTKLSDNQVIAVKLNRAFTF